MESNTSDDVMRVLGFLEDEDSSSFLSGRERLALLWLAIEGRDHAAVPRGEKVVGVFNIHRTLWHLTKAGLIRPKHGPAVMVDNWRADQYDIILGDDEWFGE